jgi:hypothetical protein
MEYAFGISKTMRCGICLKEYVQQRTMQRVCSPECAMAFANRIEAKKQALDARRTAQELRKRKEALKPRAQWIKEAQQAVNRYVRLRDAGLGCVSCDKPASWGGQWHASHLRSTGAASAVRFNLWNIHKACSVCNNYLSGNLSEYQPRLRLRIGAEKIEWLRSQNGRASYSVEYLQRLKRVFTKKAKRSAVRAQQKMHI